jgi:hypothetical protein
MRERIGQGFETHGGANKLQCRRYVKERLSVKGVILATLLFKTFQSFKTFASRALFFASFFAWAG